MDVFQKAGVCEDSKLRGSVAIFVVRNHPNAQGIMVASTVESSCLLVSRLVAVVILSLLLFVVLALANLG